ncbi:hypothetical protein ACFWY9_13960 [Amycolatopsis sp. NPDC059027]|uniref:hypothetical protein n=1 Tax=unclassified Amycolatopsis TaxID=2618356 RepID=UPI00366BB980
MRTRRSVWWWPDGRTSGHPRRPWRSRAWRISWATGSVAALSGRPAGVALGTSSVRVVEGIHQRSRAHAVTMLAETAEAVARQLHDPGDEQLRAQGFRRLAGS